MYGFIQEGGVTVGEVFPVQTAMVDGQFSSFRFSMGFVENNFLVARDGVSAADKSCTIPNGITQLQVGGNANALNGCLLNFIYYQKRLANSVIEANSARENSND